MITVSNTTPLIGLDTGTPAPQAQVRAVLYVEPKTFYQMEDW